MSGPQSQFASKARRSRTSKIQAELDEARLDMSVLRAENEDYKIELRKSEQREAECRTQVERVMGALKTFMKYDDEAACKSASANVTESQDIVLCPKSASSVVDPH